MLTVQVERDPKTGTTVVRSVAPVSAPAAAPHATTVFDDGRKTIHAVGGSGSQPSSEELEQILSVIDGVGMKVLLDEATVSTVKTENTDTRRTPEEKDLPPSQATSNEDHPQKENSRSYELETEKCLRNEENRSTVVVRDAAGEAGNVEDQRLEDVTVTLMFLGYTDGSGQGHSEEDHEDRLRVERVMITEDGEEHVLRPETPTSEKAAEKDEVFQDVSLEGNGAGVKVQGQDTDEELQKSPAVSAAEGGGTSKNKSCQCCSVM